MPEHGTDYKRKVGERGQVTIPKDLRERRGIEGGDEVVFFEEEDGIIIRPPVNEERLAEGYQKRAERALDLAREMTDASSEAGEHLGESPGWEE